MQAMRIIHIHAVRQATNSRGPLRCLHTFTRLDLEEIRKVLDPPPRFPISDAPAHTCPSPVSGRTPAESAVLVPLMNIDGEAHILMQVRASFMRVHAGEASFAGGKADPEDVDLVQTALREANEELAIQPDHLEILGSLPPEYSLGNKARVWPIVGFLHDSSTYSTVSPNLSSPPLSSLIPSPDEVSAILPFPLTALATPRRSIRYFRLAPHRPYWKFKAGDLTRPHVDDSLEVWGLSGWFLNCLAWRTGWLERPPNVDLED